MGARRRIWVLSAAVFAASLLAAPAAQAAFHLIKVREVHPGSSDDSYVVLQMLQPGEKFVGGHSLRVYDASGGTKYTFTFTAGDVYSSGYIAPNGDHGNNTILVGDTGVQAAFGVAPDDRAEAGFEIDASGGAVCWLPLPHDCVAWGNFTGAASLPSATGTPASGGGVTPGKALHRSIARGCPTLLDELAVDDTDDSSADFSEQIPNPRNNATPPIETPCVAPDTAIAVEPRPADPTRSTDATFEFTASPPDDATFECKLDTELDFSECGSPKEYSGLSEGTRTFEVRAVHPTNGTDPIPATYAWEIDLTPPTATINSHPDDPSPGNSPSFTYESNEAGSTFECSLSSGGPDSFSACLPTGKTFPDLADGTYTFKVRATDPAGNQGAPEAFPWTVDNSLADTTPPETFIDAKPPDPSGSSTVSFSYSSNEPESTFECELDGAGFTGCSVAGITYSGLTNGPHTFEVRATDPSGNIDESPAGYTFDVVASLTAPSVLPPPAPIRAGQGTEPPQTRILKGPRRRTRDRTPTFRFRSNRRRARFQCKLDRGRFRGCRSPFTTRRLSFGRHVFRVRAIFGGAVDRSSAKAVFKIVKTKAGKAKRKGRAGRRGRDR